MEIACTHASLESGCESDTKRVLSPSFIEIYRKFIFYSVWKQFLHIYYAHIIYVVGENIIADCLERENI